MEVFPSYIHIYIYKDIYKFHVNGVNNDVKEFELRKPIKILNNAVYLSFHANALRKNMNPSCLPLDICKIVDTGALAFEGQLIKEKEKY